MAWFTPFIVPMAIGALSSMASGRNALEGAAIGAATQGLLGGVDFGGASSLFKDTAKVATNTPVMGGLELSGATTGAVGGAAANAGTGIATSLPATDGQYSSLLGGNSALQNYDVGMDYARASGGVGGSNASIGNTVGVQKYPDYTPIPVDEATNGYVYTPAEQETMANLKKYGGMTDTGDVVEDAKLFGGLIGDEMSAGDIMGYTQLANQAYNAQTEPFMDISGVDAGRIAKKEVSPDEGRLLAINVPSSEIDKKVRFYG